MLAIRVGMILTTLLFLAVSVPAAAAQQSGQRRVLTNEDVARPAPPAPAAAESPAAQAVAPEAAKASAGAIPPGSTAKSELQRAMELQAVLRDANDGFFERSEKETIEARKRRWEAVVNCLNTVIQYNQLLINELQEQPAGSTAAPQTAP